MAENNQAKASSVTTATSQDPPMGSTCSSDKETATTGPIAEIGPVNEHERDDGTPLPKEVSSTKQSSNESNEDGARDKDADEKEQKSADSAPEEKMDDLDETRHERKRVVPSESGNAEEDEGAGQDEDASNDDDDNDEDDNDEEDPSYEPDVDGMEEMTEEEEKSAMLNIVLSELLRKFREENGRGPSSLEVLEIRASVAEQLEMEVATPESLEALRQQQHEDENGKKRAAVGNAKDDTDVKQPPAKRVKFHESVKDEEPDEEEDSKIPAVESPKQQPAPS